MTSPKQRYEATKDFYETPRTAILAIAPHLPQENVSVTLDPCAGRGAILRTLRDETTMVGTFRGIEFVAEHAKRARQARLAVDIADALALPLGEWGQPELIVMNPPYRLATQFVVRALGEVRQGGSVFALLRQAFISGKRRRAWHQAHQPDRYELASRPKFIMSVRCSSEACEEKWRQPATDPRPLKCFKCGSKVTVSTTDTAEYTWFHWGPKTSGRWFLLDDPPNPLPGAA